MDNLNKNTSLQTKNYKLTINGSTNFVVNGLKNVIKTSPEYISAEIGNVVVEIFGNNFKVTKLNVGDGILEADGEVTDFKIKQGKDNTPFFKRIFK